MPVLVFAFVIYLAFAIALALLFRNKSFRKWWQESQKEWHTALLESQWEQIIDHKIGEDQ